MVIKKKVLIVEDDLLQVYFLKKAISHLKHQVVGSTVEGYKAIDLAIKHHPDIVLMDVTLSGKLNGLETAERILQHVDCYIIFLTGNMSKNLQKQTQKLSSSPILYKPITTKMIGQAIDNNSRVLP
jgi:CheY-like chemotaxis protein